MEKILDTQTRFLSESSQTGFQSRSQGRPKAFDPERLRCSAIIAASLGTCQISVHRKEQYNRVYPQTWTANRQPIVKGILQRANPEKAEAVFGPTVYVMVDLDGQRNKALVDSRSNVNVLSEKAYSQYEQRSKLRPFREQVLSGTNDPFEIFGVFTGKKNVRHRGLSESPSPGDPKHRRAFDTWNPGDGGE